MEANISRERRRGDRRRRPAPLSRYFWIGGRRRGPRRASDQGYCYSDRYDGPVAFAVFGIMLASALDAGFTLHLISRGAATEANPLLAALLAVGDDKFLLTKLAVTGLALVFLVVHHHRPVFRRVRVRGVLLALLALYSGVLSYELILLRLAM